MSKKVTDKQIIDELFKVASKAYAKLPTTMKQAGKQQIGFRSFCVGFQIGVYSVLKSQQQPIKAEEIVNEATA